MLHSDKCVVAGEAHQVQDDNIDTRRELMWLCGTCGRITLLGLKIIQWDVMITLAGVACSFFCAVGELLIPVVVAVMLFISAPALVVGGIMAVGGVVGEGITRGVQAVKGGCLPGDALVQQLINGQPTLKQIASVPHGAHLLTSGGFSPIYLFSHKDAKATAVMRHIETESGHAIQYMIFKVASVRY